jgi:hypothetical protein
MGLDITAYSHLNPIGLHLDLGTWCEDDDHILVMTYDAFPESYRGLPDLGRWRDFIVGGCYAITPQTETHRFRAGSYGGYGAWRDDLREQFNPESDPDGAFYELIYFADNEGAIGPEAAADLLKDFEQYANAYAAAHSQGYGGDQFRERYDDWTRAFRLAAHGGLVDFH